MEVTSPRRWGIEHGPARPITRPLRPGLSPGVGLRIELAPEPGEAEPLVPGEGVVRLTHIHKCIVRRGPDRTLVGDLVSGDPQLTLIRPRVVGVGALRDVDFGMVSLLVSLGPRHALTVLMLGEGHTRGRPSAQFDLDHLPVALMVIPSAGIEGVEEPVLDDGLTAVGCHVGVDGLRIGSSLVRRQDAGVIHDRSERAVEVVDIPWARLGVRGDVQGRQAGGRGIRVDQYRWAAVVVPLQDTRVQGELNGNGEVHLLRVEVEVGSIGLNEVVLLVVFNAVTVAILSHGDARRQQQKGDYQERQEPHEAPDGPP